MLIIYTIVFFFSTAFYYLKLNVLASVVMIALAIFLFIAEWVRYKRIINVRGLFALGFIGGFGLSLLKLSKLSTDYSMTTFFAIFISYFSLYLGASLSTKNNVINVENYRKKKIDRTDRLLTSQDILIIVLIILTLVSFATEAIILKFIPLFTIDTPHAYSTFHVFGLHYITSLYVFIPGIAIVNFMTNATKKNIIFVIISFVYVVVLSLLMISRAKLILSIIESLFVILIFKYKNILSLAKNKKNIIFIFIGLAAFILLYLIITVTRAHNITYLKGIFEMKNDNIPIFIAQPYMYIAHNFENLNYMINNTFRLTFGRRILFPLFTLLLIKKFFPMVVESPYYIIKPELSTVTLIYDFYYDFGLLGVAIFCFVIGYVGKTLEDRTYFIINEENVHKNNYIVLLFALFSFYMLFSFFQSYFSLTDTWINILFLTVLILVFKMNKESMGHSSQKGDIVPQKEIYEQS